MPTAIFICSMERSSPKVNLRIMLLSCSEEENGIRRSVETFPGKVPLNRRSLGFAPPDFLLRFVAFMYFMRLSLRKGAHAARSSATWQEIRVGMTKGRAVLWSAVDAGQATPQVPRLRSG